MICEQIAHHGSIWVLRLSEHQINWPLQILNKSLVLINNKWKDNLLLWQQWSSTTLFDSLNWMKIINVNNLLIRER